VVRAVFDSALRKQFDDAARLPQLRFHDDDIIVVHRVDGKEIRRYFPVVTLQDDDILKAVNNLTEWQRGNAVSILMNPEGKVGLIEADRPIVPPERMAEYTAIWDKYADDLPTFVRLVIPMLGVVSFESPQGYSEGFEESGRTAEREGGEEGGCRVLSVEHIGHGCTDPANRADPVHIYLAKVDPTKPARHERDPLETNTGRVKVWVNEDEYFDLLSDGKILNGLTTHALSLLRAKRRWR